jgi:hypothetical protein
MSLSHPDDRQIYVYTCQQVSSYLPLVQKAGPQSPNGRQRLYCEKCGDKSYRARKRERALEAEQAQDWSACCGLAGSGPMPPVPDEIERSFDSMR